MRLHKGTLAAIQREAALAVTQGWKVVPVNPEVLLALIDSHLPAPEDEKVRQIETLRKLLADVRVTLRESQRDGQRRFADGVQEGRKVERRKLGLS